MNRLPSTSQGVRRRRTLRGVLAALAFACAVLLLAAGCGPSNPPPPQTGPEPDLIIQASLPAQFDASVSYDLALEELTNLGFQPAAYCGFQSDVEAGWVITGTVWKPAGQRDVFAGDQRIFVVGTPAEDPNSAHALRAFPGLQSFTSSQNVYCSLNGGSGATPTSGPVVLASLPSNSLPDLYTQVTFAVGVAYAQALYEISNLGLRLADPCYEEALAYHPAPVWHPMSQRVSFSTSQRLVVAPAPKISATTWTDQLHALTDVHGVTTPYSPSC